MDAKDVVEALRPRKEIRKRPAEACRHNVNFKPGTAMERTSKHEHN